MLLQLGSIPLQNSFADSPTEVLTAGIQDNPGIWWVGEGLKKGDFFSYDLCFIYYKDCAEFQMDWWIEDEITVGTEKKWLAQVAVYDGSHIIIGNMELSQITLEPTGGSEVLSPYTSAYKSSIVWLSSFANADKPKAFSAASWGKIANIGGQQIIPTEMQTVTVSAGTFDTALIVWRTGGQDSKVWVLDDFPFPIKAYTFVHVASGIPPTEYQFELLDYKENVLVNPFANVTPTEPPPEPEPEPEPEPIPDEIDVDVRTSSSEYEDGDLIIILGEVSFVLDDTITITIQNEQGNTLIVEQVQVSNTGSFSFSIQTPHSAFSSGGTHIVRATYGDESAVTTFNFIKESEPVPPPTGDDTIPPELLIPSDIQVSVNDQNGVEVEFSVKGIDNIDQIITPTCIPSSGSIFPVGETIVSCTVTDSSGNTDTDSFTVTVEFSEFIVPEWIKDVAGFWCNEEIDDASFVQAIQYLITSEVLIVPPTESGNDGSEESDEIPAWIKNNACWWSQGVITDGDFINGLQYLIGQGIIKI